MKAKGFVPALLALSFFTTPSFASECPSVLKFMKRKLNSQESSYSWLRIPAKNRRVSEQPFCRMGCWRLTPEKSPSPTRCLFFKVGIHLHV